jgi:CBS domain containing-hemolysin-like protein
MRVLGQNNQNLSSFFTKQDLEVLLREGEQGGSIDPVERKIITKVLRLSNRHVREVMIPRTEMVTLPPNVLIKEAKEIFQQSGFSRLPIIGENLDDIKGIVCAKDLLNQPKCIEDISRDVMYVPQTILCSDLIKQMKVKHITLAIALDEYGGTAGLVTVEDIIEELFGEISDEFDDRMIRMKKLSEHEILANGKAEIFLVNEKMKWKLPHGNYETVGGMILDQLGKIPEVDEIIKIDGFTITVLRVDDQRIRFVKIRKNVLGRKEKDFN